MSGVKQERAIVELFNTIENISKSNDENDTIINKVKNGILIFFNSCFDRQKARKERKIILARYKGYIQGFQELLLSQMLVIDSYVVKQDADINAEVFSNLKMELLDYCIKAFELDFADMSEFFSSDLLDIYRHVRIYDLLEKYHNNSDEAKLATEEPAEQNKSASSDWKTFFYIIIDMKNQSILRESLFSNYIARTHENMDDDDFFVKRGTFHTTDFQGRLSRHIFYQRKRLNLTQLQLANRSGVDRTMIAKIERVNQKPTLETATKLLSALNLELAICPTLKNAI